jgi:hypothetical protein
MSHNLSIRCKKKMNIATYIYKNVYIFPIIHKYFHILTLSFLLSSCSSDPCGKLSESIDFIIKDQVVSNSEFDRISEQVQKSKQCNIPGSTPCDIQKFIQSKKANLNFEKSKCSVTLPRLKFYLENSDSMDGYLRGSNDFKDSITNLAVRLKTNTVKMEFHFINSEIIPINKPLEGFIKELNLGGNYSYSKSKSNTFGSDLNSIFSRILKNLDSNEIAVFITDGIYSIQESTNIQTELFNSQNLTMNAFIEAIQNKSISTLVLQYESNFDGNYYDMKHIPHFVKTKKPFYMFIIAENEILGKIWRDKAEDIKKNSKLKNYLFFNKETSDLIAFMLLSNYKKKGSKKINDRLKGSIGNLRANENGRIGFSLLTDYSKFKDIENITENKNNYKLNPLCDIEIEKFEENFLDSNEKIFLKKFPATPTHIIALDCDKKIEKEDKLSISLLKKNSNWVKNSTLNTDLSNTNWQEFKTFGIENLISGISDAYEEFSRSDTYFTIQLNIER